MKNVTSHIINSDTRNADGSQTLTQHDANGALVPRATVTTYVEPSTSIFIGVSGTLALPTSGTLSASFSGPVVDLLYANGFSVTFVATGALAGGAGGVAPQGPPTGSFSVWGSNDVVLQERFPASGPKIWFQITQNDTNGNAILPHATLGSGSVVTFDFWQPNYRYAQPRWSHTAGSGSLDVWITKKGI